MIRQLDTHDFTPDNVMLGTDLFVEGGMIGTFNQQHFMGRWHSLLETGVGAAWGWFNEHGDLCGAIGGVIIQELNTGDVVAQEAFWYVRPEHRGTPTSVRLFETFEAWAKEIEADRIVTVYNHKAMPTGTPDFYKSRGYVEVETSYFKPL